MCTFRQIFFILFCLLSSVSAHAEAQDARIIFDQGHNQRFLIEDKGELHLSQLAEIFRGQGSAVNSSTKPLDDELLKSCSALVISGAFDQIRPEEVEVLLRFMERGGRLAVMMHIGSPLTALLARLDLDHSMTVIHERANIVDADINFRITALGASPFFSGIPSFTLYGGWALNPGPTVTSLAKTSADAWADLDGNKALSRGDVIGAFTVVVSGIRGSGSFVVFGDDAIFQNRYLDENNRILAANLGAWLARK